MPTNGQYEVGELVTSADANNVFSRGNQNAIINGDFFVNQRGFTSTTTTATYGFDRWYGQWASGTTTYSAETFALGNPISGYEPRNYARLVTSSQSGASGYARIEQRVEGVRTFAGQTTTVSFWAKAASGTPKIAIELQQYFGTGGSPSTSINTYAGQATLSTSWARYSLTVAMPSIAGKTIGTSNNDFVGVYFYTSAGTDWDSRTGALGLQNTTIDIWGVQWEAGEVATPFQIPNRGDELARCQRYYYRRTATNIVEMYISGYQPANTNIIYTFFHPVPMRGNPTLSSVGGTWSALNSAAGPFIGNIGSLAMIVYITVNAGITNANQSGRYSEVGAYLEAGAEL